MIAASMGEFQMNQADEGGDVKEESDNLDHKWEIYINHRKHIEELRTNQINIFDKAILTMSTGALGLSILLISTFAQKGSVVDTASLAISWGLFVTCITSNLLSYGASALAAASAIKNMDEAMQKGELSIGEGGIWVQITRALNGLAVISFAVGAIFLLAFAMANASAVEARAEEQATATGEPTTLPLSPEEDNSTAPTGVTPIAPPVLPLPMPNTGPNSEETSAQEGQEND